jgi:hypothetical protein
MRSRTRRFLKLTIGAELRRQLVTSVAVRRGPHNDNVDFPAVVSKGHSVRPILVGIGDRGYDAERNHVLLREELGAMSMIPPRMKGVPLWRTEGLYRKEMKRRFSGRVYHQRAKDQTVFSVVKRTMGDEMRSVRTKGVNNEIRVRMIAYNAMRVASSLLRGFLQSPICVSFTDGWPEVSSVGQREARVLLCVIGKW